MYVFITQCVKLKREGLAKTNHKSAIDDKRLYEKGITDSLMYVIASSSTSGSNTVTRTAKN